MSDNIDIFPFQVVFSIILDLYWQHISCTPDLLLRMSTADSSLVFTTIDQDAKLLWDPLDENYKNRNKKHDAWRKLDNTFEVEPGESQKSQKANWTIHAEQKKVFATGKSAQDGQKWIYFKPLLFLKDKNVSRNTVQAEIVYYILSKGRNWSNGSRRR